MTNLYGAAHREHAFEIVDGWPPDLRACVHEFGLPIVTACMSMGIKQPSKIRLLVKEIWAGARQPSQTGTAYDTLDWLLTQAGAGISAATLRRILAEHSLAIVPETPSRAMLAASLGEVSGFNERMTKEEKHRRRLRAAIRAHTESELRKVRGRTMTAQPNNTNTNPS